jgi:hypothetical protein
MGRSSRTASLPTDSGESGQLGVVAREVVDAADGWPTATPEMAARVVAAVEERLVIVLATAETTLDQQPWSR